jgi:hypothetical protein
MWLIFELIVEYCISWIDAGWYVERRGAPRESFDSLEWFAVVELAALLAGRPLFDNIYFECCYRLFVCIVL